MWWRTFVSQLSTIVAAAFFYVIIKRIMEADRRERLAQSKFEAEQDRMRRDAAPSPGRDADGDGVPENDG